MLGYCPKKIDNENVNRLAVYLMNPLECIQKTIKNLVSVICVTEYK